ncbi:MAG: hypothetical protein LUQ06_08390 [Methylococcaceae bacterium]|nr:hypothetical protein [Methylococcaceae bacterium]
MTLKNQFKSWRAVMSEALFILTVIFVAYVVYKTVNEQKATPKSAVPKAKPEATNVVAEQLMPEIVVEKGKPTKIKPATIKNTTPSNYRFTKRWIKEALVAEGLLEKVYKNNELDDAIEATIKDAVIKLEAIDKYKV